MKESRKINSYSRWMMKTTSLERRNNPTIEDMMKSFKHRETIISRNDSHNNHIKERYLKEEQVFHAASSLFEQYKDAGVTWAACVQAIKTNYQGEFQVKWAEKTRALKNQNK